MIKNLEVRAFDKMNPQYSHLGRVGDWWKEITGQEPRECKGITIGIPVYNEAKGIRRVILREILEQRLPGEIPITIICATDGSTDGSPKIIQSIIEELAEKRASKEGGGKRKEDFIRREQFVWPHPELVDQYQEQHWPEDEFEKTIEKTTIETGDGVTIIHINNPLNQGKNNTMNMIRAHTDTPEIIFVDGDIRLHPYVIGELYGTMVKQDLHNKKPIVAGNFVPFWDQKTLWASYMRYRKTVPNVNVLPGTHLWGGLFIMETGSKSIPYFPVDLMFEDKWLELFSAKKFGIFKLADKALGFQKRPATLLTQIQEILRWRFQELQMFELHRDDLPKDFIPRTIAKTVMQRIQEFDGTPDSLLDILIILATKKMLSDFQKSGKSWHDLRTFKQIYSTKNQ